MTLDEQSHVETVYFYETKTFNFLATVYRRAADRPLTCEYRFLYFKPARKRAYTVESPDVTRDAALRATIQMIVVDAERRFVVRAQKVMVDGGVERFAEIVKTLDFFESTTEALH